MGTRAAAFTAKIRNLQEYHTRIMHAVQPLPSGVDVANTLKYFNQTLLSVLKDVPNIPLDMLRCSEKDHSRITLFPSLDYKALYYACVQLVDVVHLVQNGTTHVFGQTLLQTLSSLVPFLEHEYMDTLPYIVASALAHFPSSLHKDIIDTLCLHLLPATMGIGHCMVLASTEPQTLNYAYLSASAVFMLVFQYTDSLAHQTQLLECMMSMKRDVVKDMLCVIAYGTAKARRPAVEMLFHYWPALNSTQKEKRPNNAIGWKAMSCQRGVSCVCDDMDNEAYKICLDHGIAISFGERPPPLLVCRACAQHIIEQHGDDALVDAVLPLCDVATNCLYKSCTSKGSNALATHICFDRECASKNNQRPIRLCQACYQILHQANSEHIVQKPIGSPWSMDSEWQTYLVETIVTLLKEAEPSDGGKTSKESSSTGGTLMGGMGGLSASASMSGGFQSMPQGAEGLVNPMAVEESIERLAQEERHVLSRYGIWLLVGLCTPQDNTPPEILGRLLGMLFQWFHYTACLPDDQTGNSLERLKTEYINGWLMDIVRTHFDVFTSCLLPHPADYAQVGGHWDVWPSQTDQIKEGFKTLLCLVPYDIINRQVWEFIMPYWMEAFRYEIPQEELAELKILLSKVLDPDLSPLGFEIKQMYSFLTSRFEGTSTRVQEQALTWLQIISKLEVPVPLSLLWSMFGNGINAMKAARNSETASSMAAAAATPTPKFHPVRQDTTGTMLSSLGLDGLPSSCLPSDLLPPEKTDAEVDISCHIIMLDILIKQLELQDINPHRGLNTKESREIQNLLVNMLRCDWIREHKTCLLTDSTHSESLNEASTCRLCELICTWYQLVMTLCEFFCPVMEVAMADVTNDKVTGSGQNGDEVLQRTRRSAVSGPQVITTGEVEKPGAVASALGSALHPALHTVQEVAEEASILITPSEAAVPVKARTVYLNEDDVPDLTCVVTSVVTVGDISDAAPSVAPPEETSLWVTSVGKFRYSIDELPKPLVLVYYMLKELNVHENPDVLYHMLNSLKLLCLHAEVVNKAAHDHCGFLIWCQENLLISNFWKLLSSECSQLSRLSVPLLLHCITLPCGTDVFWKIVEKYFHSPDWQERLVAGTLPVFLLVEKLTMIGHFVEPTVVKNSQSLQSSLANAFCQVCHLLDDPSTVISQRTVICLEAVRTSSLKLFVWCLEAQFDTVIVDRPMILQTIYQLFCVLSQRQLVTWDFFLNRFDALFLEAQIHLERAGEIQLTRDLKNSNKNSEVFQRKLSRAHEALSLSRQSVGRTLTSSLGPKWPYKRTMSAPGGILALKTNEKSMLIDKEKIYNRQSSAPVLKRKSSRLGGTGASSFQHFPNSFFENQGQHMLKEAQEEGHLLHVLHRIMDMEDHDKETLHLLIFLFMEFLSRRGSQHPNDEKAMSRNHFIVLRHINILMGYSQTDKSFLISASKLRTSPVFHAFMTSLSKTLDYNYSMGKLLISQTSMLLIMRYCTNTSSVMVLNELQACAPGAAGMLTRNTLWPLDEASRHSWLMALLVILYKYDYRQSPLNQDIRQLVQIVLNTLEAFQHDKCYPITTDPSHRFMNTPTAILHFPKEPVWEYSTVTNNLQSSDGGIFGDQSGSNDLTASLDPTFLAHTSQTTHNENGVTTETTAIELEVIMESPKELESRQSFDESSTSSAPTAPAAQPTPEIAPPASSPPAQQSPVVAQKISVVGVDGNEAHRRISPQRSLDATPIKHKKEFVYRTRSDQATVTLPRHSSPPPHHSLMGEYVRHCDGSPLMSGAVERLLPIGQQNVPRSPKPAVGRTHPKPTIETRCIERLLPVGPLPHISRRSTAAEADTTVAGSSQTTPPEQQKSPAPATPKKADDVVQPTVVVAKAEIVTNVDKDISAVTSSIPEATTVNSASSEPPVDSTSADKPIEVVDSSDAKAGETGGAPGSGAAAKRALRAKKHTHSKLATVAISDHKPAKRYGGKKGGSQSISSGEAKATADSAAVGTTSSFGSSTTLNTGCTGSSITRLSSSGAPTAEEDTIHSCCPECGAILERYSDDDIGLAIVVMGTYIHREPVLAAQILPRTLRIVSRIALKHCYAFQSESNTHIPGGCTVIARQFIRCTLHQLSTNGIFMQIFQGHFDEDFFRVMALSLLDFPELNALQPVTILIEELNVKKQLSLEGLVYILKKVAIYMEALPVDAIAFSLWSSFLPLFDAIVRRLVLMLAQQVASASASGQYQMGDSRTPHLTPVLRIMLVTLKLSAINACKSLLDPYAKILSHALQYSIVPLKYMLELGHLSNRNLARERDRQVLSRTAMFELTQALKFKTSIPDENLLMLVQFLLQDSGGCLSADDEESKYADSFSTGAAEAMRQSLSDVVDFLADVHTLGKIKSSFHGVANRLNEETLGGRLKAGMAQFLALEISRGNGRDNRTLNKYFPWLMHPPNTAQQGPREFIEGVSHIRLLSWLLVGALTHSAILGNATNILCQPVPLEANTQVADHVQAILAGFAEQSKTSVLHMSSLFHVFILCQLWTMYCERMVLLNPPGSEHNQWSTLTLMDFWVKVTPSILQLICHSKVLSEMVSLHFLSLMEALIDCNSTVLSRLLPMWTPALYGYQCQIPKQLRVRLQTCLEWMPSLPTHQEAASVSAHFVKWLHRIQFKMGQIEMQSSTAAQFYAV